MAESETGTDDPRPRSGAPTIGPLDAFQRRHTVLGFPIAVVYKFVDDFGGYLCALLTYYAFFSLFPGLMLLSTTVGIVLEDHPVWSRRILESAVSDFPIVGDQLRETGTLGGGAIGLIAGGIGAIYGVLGVGQALQYANNQAWMVPRNSRPNPFASRGRGLLLLLVVGITIVLTTGVTTYLQQLVDDGYAGWAITIASVLINTLVAAIVLIIATTRPLDLRDVLPGALVAAIAWQGIQVVSAAYVGAVVDRASNLTSVFAFVLGLLVFLYTLSVVLMISVEINVVHKERLWPRALLTPFTDRVVLTEADERAYARLSQSQRLKGFQRVHVHFEPEHDEPRDP